MMAIVAKWLTHRFVDPTFVGSIPISRLYILKYRLEIYYYWGIAKR